MTVAPLPHEAAASTSDAGSERLDKWLWHARFFRSRSLSTAEVAAGRVRVNGLRITKPAHPVRPGDTLTLVQGHRVRLVRITATSLRRGAAADAQRLYLDLDAAAPPPPETA